MDRLLLRSKQWYAWKKANPDVEIQTTIKANHHPHVNAEYLHGRSKAVSLRRNKAKEILEVANSLSNSTGYKSRTWVEKKRIVTQRPSIQGQWNPYFVFPKVLEEEEGVFPELPPKYPRPNYVSAPKVKSDMLPRSIPKYNTATEEIMARRKRRAQKSPLYQNVTPYQQPEL